MINQYTAVQLKEIKGKFDELNNSMTRIAAEQDLIKEIYKSLKDDHGVAPKISRKLAMVYYKRNKQEIVAEHADFEEAYEALFEQK
jgi:hypothetical protein